MPLPLPEVLTEPLLATTNFLFSETQACLNHSAVRKLDRTCSRLKINRTKYADICLRLAETTVTEHLNGMELHVVQLPIRADSTPTRLVTVIKPMLPIDQRNNLDTYAVIPANLPDLLLVEYSFPLPSEAEDFAIPKHEAAAETPEETGVRLLTAELAEQERVGIIQMMPAYIATATVRWAHRYLKEVGRGHVIIKYNPHKRRYGKIQLRKS